MKDVKNNWFVNEIKKDEEYIVSVTFDFPNKTANVGKIKGIELPDGNVRLNTTGEVDIVPISDFLERYPDFIKSLPSKKFSGKEEEI